MPNTLLTPTQVTREALRVAHQKSNFIGTIDRQHDSAFAVNGAKIGDSIKIRKPNQFVVTDGAILSAQDTTESSVTLHLTGRKHVGMGFTTADLTLSIDDFSSRFVSPAVSVLMAAVEADALSMYKDVYNQVSSVGSAFTGTKVLAGRKILMDNLAPLDQRKILLNTQDNADLVDGNKSYFNDQSELSKQYLEGAIGRGSGFDAFENTLLARHVTGSENGASVSRTIVGANQTGSTINITAGTPFLKTLHKGDIITLPGVNRVHPETKADTGVAQQFVVTADVATAGTSVSISPAIVISGAAQNVTGSPTASAAITKVGGASAAHGISMGYHSSAFTFATADLVMPKDVHFGAREVMDGISLRIVQSYDIAQDKLPARLDILYGYVAQRPEWAVRYANN